MRFENRPSAQVNQRHWVHRAIANQMTFYKLLSLWTSGKWKQYSRAVNKGLKKKLIVPESKKQLIASIQTLLRHSEGIAIQHTVCYLSLSNRHLIDKTIHLCHFWKQVVQLELLMGCSHINNTSEQFQEYWEQSQTNHKGDGGFKKKHTQIWGQLRLTHLTLDIQTTLIIAQMYARLLLAHHWSCH